MRLFLLMLTQFTECCSCVVYIQEHCVEFIDYDAILNILNKWKTKCGCLDMPQAQTTLMIVIMLLLILSFSVILPN